MGVYFLNSSLIDSHHASAGIHIGLPFKILLDNFLRPRVELKIPGMIFCSIDSSFG